MSARNRELLILVLAGAVASTAFASAWFADAAAIDYGWLPWAAMHGGYYHYAHDDARALLAASRPVLYVGGGVVNGEATDELL